MPNLQDLLIRFILGCRIMQNPPWRSSALAHSEDGAPSEASTTTTDTGQAGTSPHVSSGGNGEDEVVVVVLVGGGGGTGGEGGAGRNRVGGHIGLH